MNNFSKISISAVIGALICFFCLKACDSIDTSIPKNSHTVKTVIKYIKGDTVKVEKVIEVPVAISAEPTAPEEKEKNWCDSTRVYNDTTRIDSTSWFACTDTIIGKKVKSGRKYIGVPYTKEVTTTITDSIFVPVKLPVRSLWLNGGGGIGPVSNRFFIGVDYYGKKRLGVGYDYDIIQKIHSGKVHYLLFGK